MKNYINILLVFILIILFSNSNALTTQSDIDIVKKDLLKIPTWITYLKRVDNIIYNYNLKKKDLKKIDEVLSKKVNEKPKKAKNKKLKKAIIFYLKAKIKKQLENYDIKSKNKSWNFKVNTLNFKINSEKKENILIKQIKIQEKIIKNFYKNIHYFDYYIYELEEKWFEIIKLNQKFEYKENKNIFKANFLKYEIIDEKNYKKFLNKNKKAKIFVQNDIYYFVNDYNIEEKIPFHKAIQNNRFITEKRKYFLKNWIYYSYHFKKVKSFNDKYGYYKSQIKNKKKILYYNNGNFYFIYDYKKYKLISADIIENIKNKQSFLRILISDKKYIKEDFDFLFIHLRKYSEYISANLSKKEKIKQFYDDIVKSLEYYNWNSDENKKSYSWILAFKNAEAVCDWYVKLFSYMLMFSWIEDFELQTWYVLKNNKIPTSSHIWIKIDGKYYDPTFDDTKKNIKNNNYNYFAKDEKSFLKNRIIKK